MFRWVKPLAMAFALAGLAAFYYLGATEHARILNTERGRADQSGYLWDAVGIHSGRHGGASGLIGERNRMPVYPWLLSWLYDPSMTPDEFFEVGKQWNIRLSLVLLGAIWLIARCFLPPLPSTSLVLAIGFGYFVFKAGYAQVELLYYTFFFATFVTCCRLLTADSAAARFRWAALSGVLAAVTHLTKAAVLPLVACLVAALAWQATAALLRERRARPLAHGLLAAVIFGVCFLGVLSPYLANSKRVFGHYFYNVNTTFYVWYDNWTLAALGTYRHGDGVGWPDLPSQAIPTMRSYWRTHDGAQIRDRVVDGMREMVVVSYQRLAYFKYVSMYLIFAGFVAVTAWPDVKAAARRRTALLVFLLLYGTAYALAIAFYKPISGTTLRMLLAHVAPLLFAASCLFWRTGVRDRRWILLRTPVGVEHFHALVIATVCLDVMFTLWSRVTTDFAGY